MENVRKHRDTKLVTTGKRKKPISIRTKLSYNKILLKKHVCSRNEKKQK